MNEKDKILAFRKGAIVLGILAVLTGIEFAFGSLTAGWWAPLMIIALVKAFFVLRDYMHLPRLFATEDEGLE